MGTIETVVVLASVVSMMVVAVVACMTSANSADRECQRWAGMVKPLADRMLSACGKELAAKYAENDNPSPAPSQFGAGNVQPPADFVGNLTEDPNG